MLKYVQIRALKTRGPVEGGPDREVVGTLLATEEPVLVFNSGMRDTGHDEVSIYPAFHDGGQCWIETRRWVAAHGYSAWGTASNIIPFRQGVDLLIERGMFRLDSPTVA